MSITFSQCCCDCAEDAPDIGDGGYIGAPTLSLEFQFIEEFGRPLATFGWITEPLRAIGLCTYEVERFADWLAVHHGHRTSLYHEHPPMEIVRRDDALGRSGWTRMAFMNRKAAEAAKREAVDSGAFQLAHYSMACSCGEGLLAPEQDLLRPVTAVLIEPATIDSMLERWQPIVDHAEPWVHRLMEIIDPDNSPFMADLLLFLSSHRDHALSPGLRS